MKNKRYIDVVWELFEELLEENNLETALARSLEILVRALHSEESVIWLLDRNANELVPMFHTGRLDLSNFRAGLGEDLESFVTKSGESVLLTDVAGDKRFAGTLLDQHGFAVRSMLCVPLNDLEQNVGCMQLINKKTGNFTAEDAQLCGNVSSIAALDILDKGYEIHLQKKKEPIISLKGIKKTFPSGDSMITVLKGIDLDIYEGEFLVILGESGCGKSTMLNIIGGMDFLSEGTLTVDGKDFSKPSDKDLTIYRRDYIGFIFQSYNLMPNLTAKENIEFVAENSKNPLPADDVLKIVGMYERAGHFPAQMSGGQQQRISIARALAKNPRVILADEPTAALDFQTGQEVLVIVEDIVRNQKKTVVMITHNAEIAKMADRVVKLRGGLISSVRVNTKPLKAVEIIW